MRKIFNKELLKIAAERKNIYMVLADIGYGEIEPFANTFPDRFINCGVAEQEMTGVACGVAMEGNTAITYSIANFPTLRCLEQIRNDVCYHDADVKIVIIGGGVAYGELGMSHHSTEDIAIMRALPNMVVLVPSDGVETRAATHAMLDYKGPVYFRCGYKNEPDLHDGKEVTDFRIGGSSQIRDGKDATVFFAGTIGVDAKKAVEELEREKEKYNADYLRDQAQIKELNRNPKAIEKIARERYYMKADDEDIFVLSDDERDAKPLETNERVE